MHDGGLKISITGMSWYYKEDFENIKKIFVDGENICKSYEDWLRMAEKGYNHLVSNGVLVEKVYISSKYFPKWCKENNLELNSKARLQFGNEIVYKKYLEKQQFDALCPIFLRHNLKNTLTQIGTGVLLRIDEHTFLFTAAHVIDEIKYGYLLIPTNSGLKEIEGSYSYLDISKNKTRKDDIYDIGYYKLDNDFVKSLHKDLHISNTNDIYLLDDATKSMIYTFAGYPHSKSIIKSGVAQSEPYYYSGYSVGIEVYSRYGCDPAKHIIVQYRRNRSVNQDGEKIYPPIPSGISGGGIYVWPEDFQGQPTPPKRQLIGIGHTYKKNDDLLIGTNIREFMKCIVINNPHIKLE
ncbi:MAG TPA: hypothetical protein PKD67_07810 [Ignavibacteriaceae bacterium]|nr:hypothetical protein [Ignavibacteriaceae bacterium]